MGHCKSSAKGKIHSITGLPQETRKKCNSTIFENMLNPVLYVVHVCIHKDYTKKVRVHSNLVPTALAGTPCKKQLFVSLPETTFAYLLSY